MSTFCPHVGCLERELHLLCDLERALWERVGGDVVVYAGLMAKYKAWLVSQVA